MSRSVLVLGAGMVGTCTALHLQRRGFEVVLADRRAPGLETSFGNAGLIQRESVEPYPFPREAGHLFDAALRRGTDVHWHLRGLLQMASPLLGYWRHSRPAAHARATQAYARLIAHAITEHAPLIAAAKADDLIRHEGFRFVFRSARALDEGARRARRLEDTFGVRHRLENAAALAHAEPALHSGLAGAVHWLDPWSVSDPGALVQRYAKLFEAEGGRLIEADAMTLHGSGSGWSLQTAAGRIDAAHAVVALGPWSDALVRRLGYRMPLFIKRGYHQHYPTAARLRDPLLDAEFGYVLAPMRRGLRLTTGAELAPIDAAPTPVQVERAERKARDLLELGDALTEPPWLGARPCTADMLPVMGPAPRHPGLWFNFGHSHQGFTLGPVAGRLVASMIAGEALAIDPVPYAPTRFS